MQPTPWFSEMTGGQLKAKGEREECDKNPEKYPWVKIGNLYVTVMESGGIDSWSPLIKYIKSPLTNKVLIMSGRHGGLYGSLLKLGGGGALIDKAKDPDFFKYDAQDIKRYWGPQSGMDVQLVDCSGLTPDALKQNTRKSLLNECPVIFAWCFSLYTFNELIADSSGRLRPSASNFIVDCHNVPIISVVRSHFRWAF